MNLLTRNYTTFLKVLLLMLFTNLVVSCSEDAPKTVNIDGLIDNARNYQETGQYQAAVIRGAKRHTTVAGRFTELRCSGQDNVGYRPATAGDGYTGTS